MSERVDWNERMHDMIHDQAQKYYEFTVHGKKNLSKEELIEDLKKWGKIMYKNRYHLKDEGEELWEICNQFWSEICAEIIRLGITKEEVDRLFYE